MSATTDDELIFERPTETASGEAIQVSPLVRRLVAGNPSAFTATGTCSYIVGGDEVAIIDPGPPDEAHVEALLRAVSGRRAALFRANGSSIG
jgi:glyoxylase-like metal-dependent hydrolase (beta-lactamase superfamily II)